MRAAIYIRVSTEHQAEEGFSLDAQLERLRAFCTSQDWSVASVYTDNGFSAKDTQRPELQRMLSDVRANKIDVVLVYKLDRLTRSVLDLYELLNEFTRYNVGFRSATETYDTTTAVGRLFITLVASLAQWERETIAERTKMGQIEMTKQGKWSGGHTPFGYNYTDGKLIVNELHAVVVREIYRRYTTGEGTVKILQWLNDPKGPQAAPHNRWTQNALKYVLRNPLYAGFVRYGYRNLGGKRQKNPVIEPGNHEPIISKDLFDSAESIRKQRSTMPTRSGTGTYSLSGLLYCGSCGAAMAGRTHYRQNKDVSPPRRTYICTERMHSGLCKQPTILESDLESHVLDELIIRRTNLSNRISNEDSQLEEERKLKRSIELELAQIEQHRERWMDVLGDGKIPKEKVYAKLDELDEREEQLKAQLNDTPEKTDPAVLQSILETLEAMWEDAEPGERKEMLRLVVKKIEVREGKEIRVIYRE